VSSADVAKRIHEDVDGLLRSLSLKDQKAVLNEAHNIVESLKKIERITSKIRA